MWAVLEPSWAESGHFGGYLESSWTNTENSVFASMNPVQEIANLSTLGPNWAGLEPSWTAGKPSWSHFGLSWTTGRPSWDLLGPFWAISGHLGQEEAVLEAFLGHLEKKWGKMGQDGARWSQDGART